MYCKYCGKQIDDDSCYCRHCGKNVLSKAIDETKSLSNESEVDQYIYLASHLTLTVFMITRQC